MKNLMLAGAFFAAAAFGQTGVVTSGSQPIPGATVKATQGDRVLTTVTDDNGAFQFDGMSPGMWNVSVEMFGFQTERKEVTITATPTKIDFSLSLRERRAFGPGGGRGGPGGPGGGRGGAQGGQGAEGGDAGGTDAGAIDSSATPAAPPGTAQAEGDSLLISGTMSQGAQTNNNDFRFGPGGDFGPGGPGGFGQGGPGGPGGPGGRGGFAQGGPGGPGGGGPGGGGLGGGGGRGGGGGFGGGPGGGRGGPGGRGQRVPRDQNGNAAFIGNRRSNNNRITGSLFYTFANSALNARPFSVNGIEAPKAAYAQNRFGFSAGGPLVIPKLFDFQKVTWFFNYAGNLTRSGVDQAYNVPTAAERNGDLSLTSAAIFDPSSGLPFAGNQIPLTRISSIAQGLLNFYPLPNQPISTINQNYRLITANPNNTQSINTRLNTSITQKDTLGFVVNYQNRDAETHQLFGCCDETSGHGFNGNINWRHRLGTRSFETLTFNFNRNYTIVNPYFYTLGQDVASELGISGPSQDPRNYGPPSLSFANYSGLSDGNTSVVAVQSFGLNDSLTMRKGKHNLSFGGGWTHLLTNTITDSNGRGSFSFSGTPTAQYINGVLQPNTGYDFADFLLGLPETSSIRYGAASTYFRTNSFNAFANDDFRVASGLTINFGLRWEYFEPWSEKYNHVANLDIGPGFSAVSPVLAGQTGALTGASYPSSLINPDRNNFAPRIGIAWKPSQKAKILIKAGYSWFYNPGQYNQFMSRLSAQPPFAITNQVTTSTALPLTLATGLITVPAQTSILNTFAVALDYHDMYAQTWNFGLQRDLPQNLVMEVTYLGTKGTRLDVPELPNQAPLGSAQNSQQRLPIANATTFTFDDPVGNSIYHAGQLRLTRRFTKGISANLLYTYSKAIDDAVTAQNFYDQSAERAISTYNHTHVLNLNFVYASPVDAARGVLAHPVFLAKAMKDWTLSGSVTAQTGAPLTPTVTGNRDGTASPAPLRAEATGESVTAGSGWFNTAAFVLPAPATYGNAGRDVITGPGSVVLNLSLARSINLHSERRRLEVRFDTNNILNHVNPSGLVTVVNSSQYGLITGAGAMRSVSATVRLRF